MLIWFLMAFQAGAINAGAFLGCHRFVSHVTGFATLFGTEFVKKNYSAAFGMAIVPLFFLLGTMISAYFIDRRIAAGKMPQYTFLISIIAILMLIAAIGGQNNQFGQFSPDINADPNIALLALLCLACGIQNASITSASGSVVRTTHLSGITTDLGIGLIRAFSKGQSEHVQFAEKKASIMRIGIILSFMLGSTVSAYFFIYYQFAGFFLPAMISSGLLLVDIQDQIKKNLRRTDDRLK